VKRLCITDFSNVEHFICPYCFWQMRIDHAFCGKCGRKTDAGGEINNLDEFKEEIRKFKKGVK